MATKVRCALIFVLFVLGSAFCAYAQLRPEVTVNPKPKKPPAAKVTSKPAEKPAAKPAPPEKAPELEPAQIIVETSPNAEVYFDDQYAGRANPQGRLVIGNPNPGDHALRVSLTGKRNYEQTVTVVAGQVAKVAAVLADLPGRVVVRSSPGAEVFIDESRRGTTDNSGQLLITEVAVGSHELRITAPGKREHRQNITVAAGQETAVEAALEDLAPTAGTVKENSKDGLKYVWIPPGNFLMGCSPGDSECSGGEKPSHQVRVSKGFWMGQTEVTVGAYKRFASAPGRGMPKAPNFNPGWSNQQMPIVNVDWDDAEAYCRWAGGRLPTEAEWEYAARAGSTEPRYGSIDGVAWYSGNSGSRTHEVGQKRPNAFSLYDMLGDVWEWVSDWYDGSYYANSPEVDPLGPSSARSARHLLTSFSASGFRGLRGGSWSDKPRYVRASYRGGDYPGRDVVYGCRCVWEAGDP